MGHKIWVAPAVLRGKAGTIRGLARSYGDAYRKIYVQVDSLRSTWRGADNDAFTVQIEGFRQDLDDMRTLMMQCADFLDTSADEYARLQEDAKRRASGL